MIEALMGSQVFRFGPVPQKKRVTAKRQERAIVIAFNIFAIFVCFAVIHNFVLARIVRCARGTSGRCNTMQQSASRCPALHNPGPVFFWGISAVTAARR
jgi:hypothetical protein